MDRYTKGFIVASLAYFVIAAFFGVWMGVATAPEWAEFGHVHFNLLGFMAMMVYGVGYFILPRFNAKPLLWPSLLPVHFYCANIGLLGLVAAYAGRPSPIFTLFAVINVAGVAMFALNIGMTVVLPDRDEANNPESEAPEIEITADTRMAEIINRWPELIDLLINNGFTPLADPGHREKIKQMPITLGMACQRHGLDVELLAGLLTKGARSLAVEGGASPTASSPSLQTVGSISAPLHGNEPISHLHIIGDVLKRNPATEKVFRKYYGSACFSCPGQATESIRQSAMIHNVDEKTILSELNRVIAED